MKYPLILLGSILAGQCRAHYLFGRLILDNTWTKTWEYIREISPAPGIDPDLALVAPNIEPNSPDLRCGRNATLGWSKPKTATLQAGGTVGFAVGEPKLADGYASMYHPGFASAWLSKSPTDDLSAYSGDGDWFKILSVTGRTEQSIPLVEPYDHLKAVWGTWNAQSWNFTIPKTTPPGKYLLRFEHIFPNPQDSQFYVNCAHVNIVNNGNEIGSPGPLVKIPGVYTRGQPDVYFNKYDLNFNISQFVAPKPVVWEG